MQHLDILSEQVRACDACRDVLPLGPRPVFQLSASATILIASQAPGTKVHASGIPFDDNVFLAVHIELLVKRGVTLMEHLKLSELAADGCHEFLFSVGALPVTGAAGSPINPVAIG